MVKSENKTRPTDVTPETFLAGVAPERRREDGYQLLHIFGEVTGLTPRMWGASLIGYGSYHYKYDSGREDDFMMTGFSPRKTSLVVYVMPGYRDFEMLLSRLGKHKIGKSCLYINKLSDVDMGVLREIISDGFDAMQAKYPDWKS